MFVDSLKNEFGYDTPIFTNEMLDLFPQYTRAYVFRLIKKAENNGELMRIDSGVYYLPQETPFGPSVVTASDVARKRYIQNGNEVYGLYAGLALQNSFSVTTQMTNVPEIITNNEATRRRLVTINGMSFVLRKSKAQITKENVDAYRILQLFAETNGLEITGDVIEKIKEYMRANRVKRSDLLELASAFPDKVTIKMVYAGVL